MVTYEYDIEDEVFKRKINENDKKGGKSLYVNITEANKIISLVNLGYTIPVITKRVELSNPKAGSTTVRTFITRYKNGDIIIPKDAPAPSSVFESITDSDRLNALEKRVTDLENKFSEIKTFAGEPEKVSWRKRLGL